MVIDNPREIHDLYDIQTNIVMSKDKVGTTSKAVIKATGAERLVKAIKKIMMQPGRSEVAGEIDIMRELDHPNITLLREIFEDTENVFLVFEFCNGGTLQSRLNSVSRFTEVQAAITMQQVLRAVFYLHAKRICHRDLTPKNVLICSTGPDEPICASTLFKVCGFGAAATLDRAGRLSGQKGTVTHRAPEISSNSYTVACDLWSCGVIMYQVLCGQLPFSTKGNASPRSHIVKGEQWKQISQGARDLISRLIEPNVETRYSAEQALRDKWIKKAVAKMAHVPLDASVFHNLRQFRSHPMFKRAVLQIIATMLNQAETSTSRKIFHLADLNGDGMINVFELMEQIRKSPNLKIDIDMDELEEFFMDTRSIGVMKEFSYTEFLAATFDRKECLREDVLWSAYTCFDRNGDGSISFSELGMGHLLGDLSNEELQASFANVDTNQDANIDFQEFKAMMLDGEGIDDEDIKLVYGSLPGA